jgi:hypothetical protein
LGLVTVIAALTLGWLFDHQRLTNRISALAQPISTIEGRVTYQNSGQPAAGVRILAQTTAVSHPPPGDPPLRRNYGVAKTDADGHYKFVDLSPANWNIFVDADGWTASAIDSLPLESGQDVTGADLQLVKGGFLNGRVIDEAGNPVALAEGRRVVIGVYGPARPKRGAAIQAVFVNAKGQFRIRVPQGLNYPYIASVMPQSVLEGQEFETDGVTVDDGKTTEIEFRIKSSSGVLSRPVWPPVQPEESETSDK